MCGRTACTLEDSTLCKACNYKDAAGNRRPVAWQATETGDGRRYFPCINLAPSSVVPCIVSGQHFMSNDKQILHPMIWGMIPRWHKGDYKKHGAATHNARIEGLSNSKMYSHALNLGQRCVIICEGYYEWNTVDTTDAKQPYFIYAKQDEGVKIEERTTWKNQWSEDSGWKGIKVLKLAGIFDSWSSEEGKKFLSCSMITTEAKDVLSWLHRRVPIFLDTDEEVEDWLNYEDVPLKDAIKKLHGPTEDSLKWHPVDPAMNNSRFRGANSYRPIEIKKEKSGRTPGGLMASWLKTGTMKLTKAKESPEPAKEADEPDFKRLKA